MSARLVPDGLDGERVDTATARMTGLTRSRVSELIEEGRVLLGAEVVRKPATRVAGGQLLDVDLAEPVRLARVSPAVVEGMTIVHDDADVVVVDKPAGVAAHPSLGWDGPDVVSGLAGAGFRISTSGASERQGIVHRLDVGTSGLMVVAKSERAYTALKQAFRDRTVEKIYLAVVQGRLDPLRGTVEAPIGRRPGSEWKFAVTSGGRPSVTHYETIELMRRASLLRVHLETGRTHQIRVHFSALHHPCIGDPLYGSDPALARCLHLDRQWLHAARLGFVHPGSGEYVEFESRPPHDLAQALEALRAQ